MTTNTPTEINDTKDTEKTLSVEENTKRFLKHKYKIKAEEDRNKLRSSVEHKEAINLIRQVMGRVQILEEELAYLKEVKRL